jgi:hypothetical protein
MALMLRQSSRRRADEQSAHVEKPGDLYGLRRIEVKKTVVIALIAGLAIPFVGLASQTRAQVTPDVPSQNALNHTLKGTYAYLSDANDDGFEPSVGTFIFDGVGGMTGTMDMNNDGVVCTGMTLTGTYVVDSTRNMATAALTLTSVTTLNCANAGNNATLALSMSIGSAAKVANFSEMDKFITGTFQQTFDPFAGVATRR